MSEHDVDDIHEQYRIMAQIEANLRVKDNTGFDMTEYKHGRQLLKEQREEEERKTSLLHTIKPRPMLPEVRNSGGSDGFRPNNGSFQPAEPPLPFVRANRRYVQTARNRNGRIRVPELCQGVVVLPNSTGSTAESFSQDEQVVRCWGCSPTPKTYLTVDKLATLVQCPECFTVSPVT